MFRFMNRCLSARLRGAYSGTLAVIKTSTIWYDTLLFDNRFGPITKGLWLFEKAVTAQSAADQLFRRVYNGELGIIDIVNVTRRAAISPSIREPWRVSEDGTRRVWDWSRETPHVFLMAFRRYRAFWCRQF